MKYYSSCLKLKYNWKNFAWFFYFHDENENKAVEAQHRDSRPKSHDIEIPRPKKPWHRFSGTKTPRHWETEVTKPRHRDSKAFFQKTKSHKTSRFQDWKTTSRFQEQKVTTSSFYKFWPLCLLIKFKQKHPGKLPSVWGTNSLSHKWNLYFHILCNFYLRTNYLF